MRSILLQTYFAFYFESPIRFNENKTYSDLQKGAIESKENDFLLNYISFIGKFNQLNVE